jgi:hypothetical protein
VTSKTGIRVRILSVQTENGSRAGGCCGQFCILHLPWVETISVDVAMAISAEGDQIFICVVTQPASRVDVVNLKTIGTTARLASPAVTLRHFGAELAISIWIQPKPRSSRLEIIHRTISICSTNSIFCGSGSNE